MTQKYEFFSGVANLSGDIQGAQFQAQTFTPQVAHKITSWNFYGKRQGVCSGITLYLDLYQADVDHKPTGAILCSGSELVESWKDYHAWHMIALGDGANLDLDQEYVLVARAPGAWPGYMPQGGYSSTADPYPRGHMLTSIDSGATWTVKTGWDFAFEEWGVPPPPPPTPQTNAAGNITHEGAKLHGTLTDDGGEACDVRFQWGETTAYGTDTAWQPGKVTEDTFEQVIAGLDSEKTYHFRAQAKNSAGTASGADKEFVTQEAPPPIGEYKKITITHPALKTVRVIRAGQEQTKYDNLSNLDEGFIHGEIQLPVEVPADVEITTLANQIYKFSIPKAS